MRKVIPTVFDGGIEGVVVRPIRVTPGNAKNQPMSYLTIFLVTILA
jgi:hypothetical protein